MKTEIFVNQTIKRVKGLVAHEHKGHGDTLEAARDRLSRRYGLCPQKLWSILYRPSKDVWASFYFQVQHAYEDACKRQERLALHEEMIAEAMGIEADKGTTTKAYSQG